MYKMRNINRMLRSCLCIGLVSGLSSSHDLETAVLNLRSNNNLNIAAQPGEFSSSEATGTLDTIQISVRKGWNLISLPLEPENGYIFALLPDAKSKAYRYQNGYISEDTLRHGLGYWVKFDSSNQHPIVGIPCTSECIKVSQGWNMVGSFSESLADSLVFLEPYGKIISPYYSYDPDSGYINNRNIIPGKGYWIKSGSPGSLAYDSNGTKWVKVSDHYADMYTLDTARSDIIWSGTRSIFPDVYGELFKSTNRGETWDTILTSLDVGGIAFDPIDSNTIYITVGISNCGPPGLRPGILKSTDNGSSWVYADSGIFVACDQSPILEIIDWSDNNVLYAVSGQLLSGFLHRSTNAGLSWYIPFNHDSLNCNVDPRCALGMVPKLIQNRVNPDIIYAIVDFGLGPDQYLLKGSTGGTEWSYQASFPQGPYADVAVHPSNETTLYSGGKGFHISTNEGITWQESSTGLLESIYVGSVTPLKHSSSIFIIGQIDTIVGIYRSDNSGSSWVNIPFEYDDLRSIFIDEKNMMLYATSGGNLYKKRLP